MTLATAELASAIRNIYSELVTPSRRAKLSVRDIYRRLGALEAYLICAGKLDLHAPFQKQEVVDSVWYLKKAVRRIETYEEFVERNAAEYLDKFDGSVK